MTDLAPPSPSRSPTTQFWNTVGRRLVPFADAASPDLPLARILRLSLFQVSVGMALVLLTGTLNRVMIVELGVSAWLVALMAALPMLAAPFRALLGFRSDTHRSAIGWKRTPYLWFGTLTQFGGLAIMPFALIILSGDQTTGPAWAGPAAAALAFLMGEGHIVIPASSDRGRLESNFAAGGVTLSEEEMAAVRALHKGTRFIDPDKSPAWDD